MLHRLKHVAQVPAALGWDLRTPGFLKLGAQFVVLNMLKTRQAVGNRAHVASALDIVLSAQRIHATAVTAHMPGKQRQVDQGNDVVTCRCDAP